MKKLLKANAAFAGIGLIGWIMLVVALVMMMNQVFNSDLNWIDDTKNGFVFFNIEKGTVMFFWTALILLIIGNLSSLITGIITLASLKGLKTEKNGLIITSGIIAILGGLGIVNIIISLIALKNVPK